MKFLNTVKNKPFCESFQVEGVNQKTSSGGGLSGAAIAGIVIACIVLVAVIGFIIFFVKGGKMTQISAETAKGMEIPSTSLPNNPVIASASNKTESYTIH